MGTEEELPIKVRPVDGVQVNDLDVLKTRENQILQ